MSKIHWNPGNQAYSMCGLQLDTRRPAEGTTILNKVTCKKCQDSFEYAIRTTPDDRDSIPRDVCNSESFCLDGEDTSCGECGTRVNR
jgi:hypothetical protein